MTRARDIANNWAADITAVSAGVGITGGGTSGAVTVTNEMATTIDAKGDLIVGTADNTYIRQAVGTNNQVLMADSAQADGVKWANEATATLTAKGDLLGASAANTLVRISVGSNDQVLTADSATTSGIKWAAATDSTKIPLSTVTTNGDLIYGTGSSTVTRLGIGANGTYLTSNGSVPSWGTISAGGMTSLGSGTLSGSSVSITGISSTYNQILINVGNVFSSSGASTIGFRFNNISTGTYNTYGFYTGSASPQNNASQSSWNWGGALVIATGSANNRLAGSLLITNANTTNSNKIGMLIFYSADTNIFMPTTCVETSAYNTAISSVQIVAGSNPFGGGTYQIWGIK